MVQRKGKVFIAVYINPDTSTQIFSGKLLEETLGETFRTDPSLKPDPHHLGKYHHQNMLDAG